MRWKNPSFFLCPPPPPRRRGKTCTLSLFLSAGPNYKKLEEKQVEGPRCDGEIFLFSLATARWGSPPGGGFISAPPPPSVSLPPISSLHPSSLHPSLLPSLLGFPPQASMGSLRYLNLSSSRPQELDATLTAGGRGG